MSHVAILTIQCYFVAIQLHDRPLLMDALNNKNKPRINQLHFHLTHYDYSYEQLQFVKLHYQDDQVLFTTTMPKLDIYDYEKYD